MSDGPPASRNVADPISPSRSKAVGADAVSVAEALQDQILKLLEDPQAAQGTTTTDVQSGFAYLTTVIKLLDNKARALDSLEAMVPYFTRLENENKRLREANRILQARDALAADRESKDHDERCVRHGFCYSMIRNLREDVASKDNIIASLKKEDAQEHKCKHLRSDLLTDRAGT
ncbi:uncharacterized protein BKCO1_25000105 [Diplodia corticola]|uniref:Uncharacterized protein n=1 Tax=Diplodia corticola TaxID=236234 RepID=A0A1J9S388_9PEZI|nr:uncharacterized protein BKCO1_25000105 [Diplodia corticola]OJD34093.1 hypothetical protein BKCO1_25000105 [Diplodia corticola]